MVGFLALFSIRLLLFPPFSLSVTQKLRSRLLGSEAEPPSHEERERMAAERERVKQVFILLFPPFFVRFSCSSSLFDRAARCAGGGRGGGQHGGVCVCVRVCACECVFLCVCVCV